MSDLSLPMGQESSVEWKCRRGDQPHVETEMGALVSGTLDMVLTDDQEGRGFGPLSEGKSELSKEC